jgi:site-specific DNA-methyltransferase (adenine-specific)
MSWKEKFLDKIVCGDTRILLKEILSETINLIITSPPYYKQRDYCDLEGEIGNEPTVEAYINNVMKVFHECVRIVRRDGSIVFNLGDKYENGGLLLVPYRFAIVVADCAGCPRLRICVQKGSPGFLKYMREV